jgi:cell wall-associated NlpC family hydrolase
MSERAPGFTAEYADLIGIPFAWKARGPDAYDCYGLVEELERRNGRTVPNYESPVVMDAVHLCIATNAPLWQPCEVGPGAVVVLRCAMHHSHVGLVLPFGKLIHSWERSGGVCTEPLDNWRRRIVGAYTYRQDK